MTRVKKEIQNNIFKSPGEIGHQKDVGGSEYSCPCSLPEWPKPEDEMRCVASFLFRLLSPLQAEPNLPDEAAIEEGRKGSRGAAALCSAAKVHHKVLPATSHKHILQEMY